MSCLNCASPARVTCGGCKVASYCGKACHQAHWNTSHKLMCAAMLIEGKNDRKDDDPDYDSGREKKKGAPAPALPPKRQPSERASQKKRNDQLVEDSKLYFKGVDLKKIPKQQQASSALVAVTLQALKHAPAMLEALADAFDVEQLRELKTTAGAFYRTIWKNSHFWYYVLKKFRPELLKGLPFDELHGSYKKLAMRHIIAPDQTARDPQFTIQMDYQMREAFKAVARNPAALSVLLRNFSPQDLLNWSMVSREFRAIFTETNLLWYLMYVRYVVAPNQVDVPLYNYKDDYRGLIKAFIPNAPPVLTFDLAITGPGELEFMGSNGTSEHFRNSYTIFDIIDGGGLHNFLENAFYGLRVIDIETSLEVGEDHKISTNYAAAMGDSVDSFDYDYEEIPSFISVIGELDTLATIFSYMMEGNHYIIDYSLEHTEPSKMIISLEFPKDLVPEYRDSTLASMREYTKKPEAERGYIEAVVSYYEDGFSEEDFIDNYSEMLQKFPIHMVPIDNLADRVDMHEWEVVNVTRGKLPYPVLPMGKTLIDVDKFKGVLLEAFNNNSDSVGLVLQKIEN